MKILIVMPTYRREKLVNDAVQSFAQLFADYDSTLVVYDQSDTDIMAAYGIDVHHIKVPAYNLSRDTMGDIRMDAMNAALDIVPDSDYIIVCDDSKSSVLPDKMDDAKRVYDDVFEMMENDKKIALTSMSGGFEYTGKASFSFVDTYAKSTAFGIVLRSSIIREMYTDDIRPLCIGEDVYLWIKARILKYKVCSERTIGTLMDRSYEQAKVADEVRKGGLNANLTENMDMPKHFMSSRRHVVLPRNSISQSYMYDFFHYDSAFQKGHRLRRDFDEYVDKNIILDRGYNILRLSKELMSFDNSHRAQYFKGEEAYNELITLVTEYEEEFS